MASPEFQALVDQVEDMMSLVERLSDRDFECPTRLVIEQAVLAAASRSEPVPPMRL
jgi:hypothetical protein